MRQEGWKAPATDLEVQQEFFAKFGDDSYTREIDRRWRTLGKLIDKGSRIDDGRLAR